MLLRAGGRVGIGMVEKKPAPGLWRVQTSVKMLNTYPSYRMIGADLNLANFPMRQP